MNILQSGTDDISLDSGQTISPVTFPAIASASYSNLTISFVSISSYTSDVNYQTNDLSISILESTTLQKTPDLPWSISGTTTISFTIANYLSSTIPSWITLNSTSGFMNITSPTVTSDTEFDFYINSIISGVSGPVPKLIKLTILNCSPSNWQKWIITNNTICEVCNSGYYLNSGAWESSSKTAQSLSTTTTVIVGVIAGIAAISSIINATSIASLWMTINQLQLFFLLLLTRAFIPNDIKEVIEGSDFASNIYGYIPNDSSNTYSSPISKFEFELTNSSLEPFGIKYSSTIANISTTLMWVILMMLITISVYFLRLL